LYKIAFGSSKGFIFDAKNLLYLLQNSVLMKAFMGFSKRTDGVRYFKLTTRKMNIEVSNNFKKMTTKAIISIVLFLIVYIIILLLAIGLTIVSVIGGFYIIAAKPSLITLGLGLGLASFSFFILAFLFKFIEVCI
jgi:polyferredoxin